MELEKKTVIWPKSIYNLVRRFAYEHDVKFSEAVRTIVVQNAEIRQLAQAMGINLEDAVMDQPGGKRKAKTE